MPSKLGMIWKWGGNFHPRTCLKVPTCSTYLWKRGRNRERKREKENYLTPFPRSTRFPPSSFPPRFKVCRDDWRLFWFLKICVDVCDDGWWLKFVLIVEVGFDEWFWFCSFEIGVDDWFSFGDWYWCRYSMLVLMFEGCFDCWCWRWCWFWWLIFVSMIDLDNNNCCLCR